jgi:hypothetical protein
MSTNGHVQISDYSDREILMAIIDLGGEATTPGLAARLFGWPIEAGWEDKDVQVHGNRCVSQRLSWMRRFGLVESWVEVEPPKTRTWKVSSAGTSLLGAELPKAVEAGLLAAKDAAGLALANRIGERLVKAGEITGTAMRRELQFQITRRKRSR